jgi:hypothetical protein
MGSSGRRASRYAGMIGRREHLFAQVRAERAPTVLGSVVSGAGAEASPLESTDEAAADRPMHHAPIRAALLDAPTHNAHQAAPTARRAPPATRHSTPNEPATRAVPC